MMNTAPLTTAQKNRSREIVRENRALRRAYGAHVAEWRVQVAGPAEIAAMK